MFAAIAAESYRTYHSVEHSFQESGSFRSPASTKFREA